MDRIPTPTRESVPEDQRAAFDEVVQRGGQRAVRGPLAVMLNAPELAKRGLAMVEYLREGSTLSRTIRELAMLTTARELDCRFIWDAHSVAGRSVGLSDEVIDDMRDGREITGLSPEEATVVDYARELFRTHRVSQATFDRAMSQFGVRGLVELTNLIGLYVVLAFNVNAFEVDRPTESTEPPLPI